MQIPLLEALALIPFAGAMGISYFNLPYRAWITKLLLVGFALIALSLI